MSAKGVKVKTVYENLRSEYEKKIAEQRRVLEGLERELAGVDAMYRASEGLPEAPNIPQIMLRPSEPLIIQKKVKQYVFDSVIASGDRGVTAIEIMEKGRTEGKALNQSSISSLLSRLKREGTLKFQNERYYPAKNESVISVVRPLRSVEAA